jgi:hypothetical protein
MKRRAILGLGAVAGLLATHRAQSGTPGDTAAWFDAASLGDVPQLQRLAAAGMPIDRRDAAGRTALLRATAANRTEAARWLIERGADVNAQDAARQRLPAGRRARPHRNRARRRWPPAPTSKAPTATAARR